MNDKTSGWKFEEEIYSLKVFTDFTSQKLPVNNKVKNYYTLQ